MLTSGQEQALAELRSIAEHSSGALELVATSESSSGLLRADVSLDFRGVETAQNGINVRERERFTIYIGQNYPWSPPSVNAGHSRWAGRPHVQWQQHLCLYQAPSVEWQPDDGMPGLLDRLRLWVEKAAIDELDPIDGPLHAPAVYPRGNGPRIFVRADTPGVSSDVRTGLAVVERRGAHRADIVGWSDAATAATGSVAPAVLLPDAIDWEYPEKASDLLKRMEQLGADWSRLLGTLQAAAIQQPAGTDLLFVVGSPLRRVRGLSQYHLAVWHVDSDFADSLRTSSAKSTDTEEILELRERIGELLEQIAPLTALNWCEVVDERPQVVERRDSLTDWHSICSGKSIAIWGCGAIGARIADWAVRAGAKSIRLYDDADVKPGILVRQPFLEAEIGVPKVTAVAGRIRSIRTDVEVNAHYQSVIDGPLQRDDWHDGADIVFDATASTAVRSMLEWRRQVSGASSTSVVTLLLGSTAERGVATVSPPGYSGSAVDVLRKAKLSCLRNPRLRHFANEFWPEEARTDHFQPEPGCSDATFRGSSVEVSALVGSLLAAVAPECQRDSSQSFAHLVAIGSAAEASSSIASFRYDADHVLPDGIAGYETRVGQAAQRQIKTWIANNRRLGRETSETGGLLFGFRDPAARVVWIDSASGPPPDSCASPEEFVCGTLGVPEMNEHRTKSSRASSVFLGMWHTHPETPAAPSLRDLESAANLVAVDEAAHLLMIIVGNELTSPQWGSYLLNRSDIIRDQATFSVTDRSEVMPDTPATRPRIGLALSGGGSRAMAFHLGCLRALHDRGLLPEIRVLSGVSGGSVIGSAYAYSTDSFDEFDARMQALLRRGIQGNLIRRSLISPRAVAGPISHALAVASSGLARATRDRTGRVGRRFSRTEALVATLDAELFDGIPLTAPRRDGLDVVLNACDLRTGSAFRFGSIESGSWRMGTLKDDVSVATAAGISAAFPLLLPSWDRRMTFARGASERRERVVLTDGGVYDNLGTTCLLPNRDPSVSVNVFDLDHIISCDAAHGLLADAYPVSLPTRIARTFGTTYARAQNATRGQLLSMVAAGELQGAAMPFLGQRDARLPYRPADLVRREDVAGYPTNFSPMSTKALEMLSRRGEQMTHLLLDEHCPAL